MTTDMEKLVIAGREFNSRLFLGTGKFNSDEVMEQSILASGTEMVTVAMMERAIRSLESNLPVPKNKRDVNSRPAMTNFSIFLLSYWIE